MLKHLLQIAFRNFYKNRFYAAINIVCLSLGISFCLFTAVYVQQQLSVNKSLHQADRQYLLKTKWRKQDMGADITVINNLARGLQQEYPGTVANYYRYNPVANVVSAGDRFFQEDISIGDTTLVSMYGFPLKEGDAQHAFHNNGSAVITESLARKLFDQQPALGKTIRVQTTRAGVKQDFQVSAVLADLPENSVTGVIGGRYSVFLPFAGNQYFGSGDFSDSWESLDVIGFVQLQPGKTAKDLQVAIDGLLHKNSPDFIWKNLSANPFPLISYHLDNNNHALAKLTYILVMTAVFVLLMVVINFVNISIGSSGSRLKEIALKKTFGSSRWRIVQQFLAESLVLTLIASLVALALYQAFHVFFGAVLNTVFPNIMALTGQQWFYLFLIALGIAVVAGFYPALVLSKANLLHAVKGKLDTSRGSLLLRRLLLTVQFSLALFVFICALTITRQVSYLFHKDLGYDKEQLLVVTALPKQWDSTGLAKMEAIKHQMEQLSGVRAASITFDVPDQVPFGKWEVLAPKSQAADGQVTLSLVAADEDYAKTLGLSVVKGNFFQQGHYGVVLNEAAVKQLGETSEDIVGKTIKTLAGDDGVVVRGVVKDYHYSSMQNQIAPIGFVHVANGNIYRFLVLKLAAGPVSRHLEQVKDTWKSMSPNTPFHYSFMDEKFAALYKSELQMQNASKLATVLNLVIVLLGIVGVVAFMLQKKRREIAVRKVLGANSRNIILLFWKEYAGLLLLSNAIAWPLAYVVNESILQQFAYRADQSAWSYLGPFVLVAAVSLLLVALQCLRTATANPVRFLKAE